MSKESLNLQNIVSEKPDISVLRSKLCTEKGYDQTIKGQDETGNEEYNIYFDNIKDIDLFRQKISSFGIKSRSTRRTVKTIIISIKGQNYELRETLKENLFLNNPDGTKSNIIYRNGNFDNGSEVLNIESRSIKFNNADCIKYIKSVEEKKEPVEEKEQKRELSTDDELLVQLKKEKGFTKVERVTDELGVQRYRIEFNSKTNAQLFQAILASFDIKSRTGDGQSKTINVTSESIHYMVLNELERGKYILKSSEKEKQRKEAKEKETKEKKETKEEVKDEKKGREAEIYSPHYDIIISQKTAKDLEEYRKALISDPTKAGYRLQVAICAQMKLLKDERSLLKSGLDIGAEFKEGLKKEVKQVFSDNMEAIKKFLSESSNELFLELVLNTKKTYALAEEILKKDYPPDFDFNKTEIGLLAGINTAVMNVDIFDDGKRRDPKIYKESERCKGNLFFMNGVLLVKGNLNSDYHDHKVVETKEGKQVINEDNYRALLKSRLKSVILAINHDANKKNKQAVVTVPAAGCGFFAKEFGVETLKKIYSEVLQEVLEDKNITNIAAVYFDRYDGEKASPIAIKRSDDGKILFEVAPEKETKLGQLAPMTDRDPSYTDETHEFYNIVAGDPLSMIGNEFLSNMRDSSDDSAKVAATNAIGIVVGKKGEYIKIADGSSGSYRPPIEDEQNQKRFINWECAIVHENVRLRTERTFIVTDAGVVVPSQSYWQN